jgi:hypothetical protein
MSLRLDHLVINCHFALDEVAQWFRALGFTLTPKGYHTLGSINHLIMFEGHYLELIGLPVGGEKMRQELLATPPGLDGLVFASHYAEATERKLHDAGFNVQPLRHFSREVVSGNARGEARFTTVRLAAESFSAGRVYFCQHHTPEWVWRDEWLQPGAVRTLTLVAQDVDATRAQFARLGETSLLNILSHEAWQAEYGALLPLANDRDSRFAALRLAGRDLEAVSSAARLLDLPQAYHNGQLRVAIPALSLVLEFDHA